MGTADQDRSLAVVWETIAEQFPDAPAQVQGARAFTWAQFDRRADGIAQTLLDRRASQEDRVAQYLRNSPEYLEVAHAALKIGIPAVNSNYRYKGDELRYLWEDADVTAVVFHGSFTGTAAQLRPRLPQIRQWVHVNDGTRRPARTGPSRTSRPRPARPAGPPPRGAAAATTCTCCTPAGPPGCPKA